MRCRNSARSLAGADVALFYYAGHGVETHGLNYLVPVDAHPHRRSGCICANDRDVGHPRPDGEIRHPDQPGLARCLPRQPVSGPWRAFDDRRSGTDARAGRDVDFVCDPAAQRLAGWRDGHSPYTSALADAMQRPGSGLFKTFNEVGLAVEKATGGPQLPWVSSSPISGNFYFAGKPAAGEPRQRAPPGTRADPDCSRGAAVASRTIRCAAISSPIATGWRRCPTIPGTPPSLPGVEVDKINVAAATAACNDAIARYPDVARFIFEAGRVATARKDYAEARRLYEQAAAAGYAMAMNNIGGALRGWRGRCRGIMPKRRAGTARRWTPASRSPWSISAGYMTTGHGVTKDYARSAPTIRDGGQGRRAGRP